MCIHRGASEVIDRILLNAIRNARSKHNRLSGDVRDSAEQQKTETMEQSDLNMSERREQRKGDGKLS